MPAPILPPLLREGDLVRVVAPSRSLSHIPDDQHAAAAAVFASMGLRTDHAPRAREQALLGCPSVASRLADLHEAFADPAVAAIQTVIGGWNANAILGGIDWALVAANPKRLCGYSDITALQNAVFARTGLVTYSGPHSSTFAMRRGIAYTVAQWRRCMMEPGPFEVPASESWSDDAWFMDQENRTFHPNAGPVSLRPGAAEGVAIGGNLCTLNLLQGTPYMPSLDGAVLFVEEDSQAGAFAAPEFARNLQSLLHLPSAEGLRGLAIGRFQPDSRIDEPTLRAIVASMPELARLPVAAGLDFGHTTPHMTFPVGGTVRLDCTAPRARLSVLTH